MANDLFGETGGATFSACVECGWTGGENRCATCKDRAYRYHLWRLVNDHGKGQVVFLMLNPSTATDVEDDPTITRCIGFARAWGYKRLDVVNMFGLRSTDPMKLLDVADPIGPLNDNAIYNIASLHDTGVVICAWGSHNGRVRKLVKGRVDAIRRLIPVEKMKCLRISKETKQPWHPLYLPADLRPVAFS